MGLACSPGCCSSRGLTPAARRQSEGGVRILGTFRARRQQNGVETKRPGSGVKWSLSVSEGGTERRALGVSERSDLS